MTIHVLSPPDVARFAPRFGSADPAAESDAFAAALSFSPRRGVFGVAGRRHPAGSGRESGRFGGVVRA
ncbi:hypothetical protein [Herbidospora daliensis]|uniref:hypothetical protein n=1 Tax=Herbidospora daliensis TaxID=295585 RepID=UPI000783A782|nr:hypothetical protein [Herbidospora daliensis]